MNAIGVMKKSVLGRSAYPMQFFIVNPMIPLKSQIEPSRRISTDQWLLTLENKETLLLFCSVYLSVLHAPNVQSNHYF